jgi:orotidine-5'-phosphate decarboxylase
MHFADRLQAACQSTAPACVGLDPHLDRFPRPLRERFEGLGGADHRRAAAEATLTWGVTVLDAVQGLVPILKPQLAFFEQLGSAGLAVLEQLCAEARARGLMVLLDAKRGDIGSTAQAYARALLDDDGPLAGDAVTLSPYLGRESLEPFLERCEHGKGLFVLVRTSNPGAAELQVGRQAALEVAGWIAAWNAERLGSSGLGPGEAGAFRAAMPSSMLLVPGYGAQGGTARDTLPCFLPGLRGALVNSSRGVTFAGPADQARYDEAPGELIKAQAQALVADLRGLASGSFERE